MTIQKVITSVFVLFLGFAGRAEAASQAIGKLQSDPFRVIIVESANGISVALSANEKRLKTGDATVQSLSNPSRLVIELPIQKNATSTDSLSLSHPLVAQVRVGYHPGKTRFVLELKKPMAGTPTVAPIAELGAILIHLSSAPAAAESLAIDTKNQDSKPVAVTTPVDAVHAATTAEARMRLSDGAFLNRDGIIVHRGKADEKQPVEAPRQGTIAAFAFRASPDSGLDTLEIKTTGARTFSLTPSSSNTYELRLSDTALRAAIPTELGIGFDELSTSDEAPDTVVTIRVRNGISLAATASEDTLILTPKRIAQ